MDRLKKELSKIVKIDDNEWNYILDNFKNKKLKKGKVIHTAGEIFNELWYIKSGSARSYFIDKDGKEFTWQFYYNSESSGNLHNLLVDDSVSFYEQKGSLLNFETMEDSEFEIISFPFLEELFNSDIKWQFLGRMISHNIYYSSTHLRALSNMSESAPQRYQRLITEHPEIHNRVKSRYIATYLGIAPQTLSKLKNMNLDE